MIAANDEPLWYGLNMLPLYFKEFEGDLVAAHEQLESLGQIQEKSLTLDTDEIQDIIERHIPKDPDGWEFYGQCKHWRSSNPSIDEFKMITSIENTANQLEMTKRKILTSLEAIKRSSMPQQ